jgi:hypothetical protein
VRRNWRDELASFLAANETLDLAVIQCGYHDEKAVSAVVETLKRRRPGLAIAGFGALPTLAPSNFRSRFGMDFGIIGDPEPTLRHLLDNYEVAFRRQRIPSLVQEGVDVAAPLWVADLKTLAMPAWNDVSFVDYDSGAYPGGSRVDVRMSRGSGGHPINTLIPTAGAPQCVSPMDRMADMLQDSVHQGITEVRFFDPPDVWDGDVLDEWLSRLERVKNVQDWSLRLLALPLTESFRLRLVQQRCRRIEMLVPSCNADIAAFFRYDPPGASELIETFEWFKEHGVLVDLVFWSGGPEEPRGESRRINRFIRALHYPAIAIESRPDVPPDNPRMLSTSRSVNRRFNLSAGRKIRSLFSRIKNVRITIDNEQRELIVKPRGIPQAITGETSFHSLETNAGGDSSDWKN